MSTHPVVLVTGALTGIGRATALAFSREGAHVVVSGRRADEGQKPAEELRALGAEAEFVQSDVRFEDEVRDLVEKTVARFGRLDVAINSAGTEGKSGPMSLRNCVRRSSCIGPSQNGNDLPDYRT
jgi:NAD(P)-dependent dehydrogenase (short-subunit alcohol dehydrogenase family)